MIVDSFTCTDGFGEGVAVLHFVPVRPSAIALGQFAFDFVGVFVFFFVVFEKIEGQNFEVAEADDLKWPNDAMEGPDHVGDEFGWQQGGEWPRWKGDGRIVNGKRWWPV